MIRNRRLLDEFERSLLKSTPIDVAQNLRIIDALYEQARLLGAFPLKDPLEDIDIDIRYAKALRVL